VVAELVAGAIELVAGAVELGRKVVALFGQRIKVREVKSARDGWVDDTLDLYERLFKEEQRIAASELVAWLQGEHSGAPGQPALQQRLLIGTYRGTVVGMLKLLYCSQSQYGYIAYFGIDKAADVAARKVASKLMIRFLKRYVNRKWKKCRAILFEVETPLSSMSKAERGECEARLRLFRDVVRRQGHRVFRLKIDYRQPLLADAKSYSGTGRQLTVMFIPTIANSSPSVPRRNVEAMLEFLLLRVYSTAQTIDPWRKQEYEAYLKRLYEKALASLPEHVEIE
jgi:hypothetical protein